MSKEEISKIVSEVVGTEDKNANEYVNKVVEKIIELPVEEISSVAEILDKLDIKVDKNVTYQIEKYVYDVCDKLDIKMVKYPCKRLFQKINA